jgi:hypothetical protein
MSTVVDPPLQAMLPVEAEADRSVGWEMDPVAEAVHPLASVTV